MPAPSDPGPGHWPERTAALLASAAVALTAWVPMAVLPADRAAGPTAAPASPASPWQTVAAVPAAREVATEAPLPTGHPAALPPLAWREWQTIVIASAAAPRAAVAHQLALLTGVEPQRTADALQGAQPLTLHWRGSDAAQAWRLVLGPHDGHALLCDAGRCRLWLVQPQVAPAAGADSHGRMAAPSAADAAAAQEASIERATTAAQADAAEDTAVDADETLSTWPQGQPDPPGLFPPH